MQVKNILLIIILTFLGQSLKAQDFWYNPINNVPFSVVINTTASSDTLIEYFNHEKTFDLDSMGNINWRLISQNNFDQIFGYQSFLYQPVDLITYDQIFIDSLPIFTFWPLSNWDSIVPISPWMSTNRDDILTPGMMGSLIALDWHSMAIQSATTILDPTVPIIEGEDMDFTQVPGDILLDFDDYYSTVEEIAVTNLHSKYIFNKPDFKTEYQEGFIPWMIDTKPFLPDSFSFNIYHDWLYEYFHPIATGKIAQILSTEEFEHDTQVIHKGNNLFEITNKSNIMDIELITMDGKTISKLKNVNQTTIDLSDKSKGIYILNITFKNNDKVAFKLFR